MNELDFHNVNYSVCTVYLTHLKLLDWTEQRLTHTHTHTVYIYIYTTSTMTP